LILELDVLLFCSACESLGHSFVHDDERRAYRHKARLIDHEFVVLLLLVQVLLPLIAALLLMLLSLLLTLLSDEDN
jgi:hypothetical protein